MSANGRLLVVSYRFPPDGTVGGLRWAGLAKYLARDGWDIHILTAAAGAEQAAAGYHVYECRRWSTLNDFYRWFTQSGRREAVAHPPDEKPADRENPAQLVRREIASLMSFPDESRGWTCRAALRARRLVRRLRPDMVVSSGPPHSAHVVARLAVAGTDVPLVVDLRDPWSNQSRAWQHHPIYGRRIARRLVRRLERVALHRAGAVIANTSALRDMLLAVVPGRSVHWLPNGVDPERLALQPRGEPSAGLTVAHVGTLYGGRDPRIVLQAFRALIARRPDLARAGARLCFAGHTEAEQAHHLAQATGIFGLEDHVDVMGVLPAGEAVSLLRRSHLALVLAQDQELQVPGKLYEAVYLGCRTVVVAEPDSASAKEAERLGVQCVGPHDFQLLEAVFEEAADGPAPPVPASRAVIDYGAIACQLGEILRGLRRRA